MPKVQSRHLILIFKLALAAGIIFWLVQSERLDFSSLALLTHPLYFLPCLFFIGLGLAITAERWRRLLKSQGIPLSFLRTSQLVLIGTFFNYMMPGGVGGDLVKGYYIAQDFPDTRTKAVISVLMDRLIGLFSMLFLALSLMTYQWDLIQGSPQLKLIFIVLLLLFFAFCVFWSLIFSKRIYHLGLFDWLLNFFSEKSSIRHLYHSLVSYRHTPKVFFPTFVLSLLAQVSSVLFFYIAGLGLGFDNIPFQIYLFVIPVAFIIQAIPVSPAGIGIGQAALLFVFNLSLGQQTNVGPTTMTAFQIMTFFYGLLGAYFYLGISKKLKNPVRIQELNGGPQ